MQAVVVADLLAHRLAHAHPDRALHLALDGQPVERLAAVVRHPDLVDGDHAGLLVDRHLDHLRRIAVAHGAADGRAAIFLAAVRFRDGRVVAGDGDGAGVLQRLDHDLLEGERPCPARRRDRPRPGIRCPRAAPRACARRRRPARALSLLRRVDRRIADHEGDARGIGAVVLRHHLAVAGDDAHARRCRGPAPRPPSAPGWWTSPGRYRRRPTAPRSSRRNRA